MWMSGLRGSAKGVFRPGQYSITPTLRLPIEDV
jgi:hypothetical protein